MSVENLVKELDVVHEKIKTASTLEDKLALMAERDNIMRSLDSARLAQAEYDIQEIQRQEEASRAKTIQMPNLR